MDKLYLHFLQNLEPIVAMALKVRCSDLAKNEKVLKERRNKTSKKVISKLNC